MMKYPILKFHLESWIALAVIILVRSERPHFRDDYRYEKGFAAFYKLHHTAAPWAEARMRCEGEGGVLFAPANLDEADAIPLLISTVLNNYEGIFIGIHDLHAERVFTVVSDGSSMIDSILNLLWEHEEPRHGAGRCLVMRHNGRLVVRPCEIPLPFVCKVNAADIEHHPECDTFDPRWKLGPNATCYLMHTEPQDWYDAFGTCLAAGGHLAIMNSRSEAEYVRSVFREVPERRQPDNHFAFLGLNDLFQRFHYRTIKGQRIAYSGYADWSLTCGKTVNSSDGNRCGGMRRSGLLALADCGVPAMFICEKAVSGKTVSEVSEENITEKKNTKEKNKANKVQKTIVNPKKKGGKVRMGAQIEPDAEETTPSTTASTSTKNIIYSSENSDESDSDSENSDESDSDSENTDESDSDSIKSLTVSESESLSKITKTIVVPTLGTTNTIAEYN